MICASAGMLLTRCLRHSFGDETGGARDDPLRGVWRLVSYCAQDVGTGEVIHPYGERAHGYLIYTVGQRMSALVSADGKVRVGTLVWERAR